ncbi:MAG TPA: POTRA domain-containing protein, partial [Gemmatimonadaceae bacterium]
MGGLCTFWRAHSVLVFALPALLSARGVLAQNSPPEDRTHPVVTSVKFVGVTKVIDKSDLSSGLATQPSGCKGILLEPFCLFTKSHLVYDTRTLDHVELARDVVRIKVYYYRRGYRETEVDTLVSRAKSHTNRVRVTFRVTEGKPVLVKSLAVEHPDSALDKGTLKRSVLVRVGKPLNLVDIDTTHTRLRNALWDKGYADAEITDTIAVHDSARTADVTIKIDPRWVATVESVTVHGDSALTPDIARKMVTLKPGNIYKREDVIESQQTLYNSNLYRRATIVLPPRGDSAKL